VSLQRRVIHPCEKPTVPDPDEQYRWTCPECKGAWKWFPDMFSRAARVERYGFLWSRSRNIEKQNFGYWHPVDPPADKWVDVPEVTP
jgi:hypothetical protein